MNLYTERLLLRPWRESDAEMLYTHARDPEIGPRCGWMPHTSRENSLAVIRTVLCRPNCWAIVLRETDEVIGSVSLMQGEAAHAPLAEGEAEIGYWLARPYWGQGLMPETVRRVIRYAFDKLSCTALWCGFHDGNEQSRRVGEKCGFRYHHTNRLEFIPQLGCHRQVHYTRLLPTEKQA
ncbi:MAG: GNAT family N-acetyltransferase [Clostridia bacterium]|nr:GNAT family N-acetyltransferase [Clostridia bacterium]